MNKEDFDALLNWLDSARDEAGRKYEEIRRKLIKIFVCRGCSVPEELADETFNRVAKKAPSIAPTYVGDPTLYFYGVAYNVHREWLRRKPDSAPEASPPGADDVSLDCLDDCMEHLTEQSRQLIIQYYQEDRRAKIESRRELAVSLGIELNTLRLRAYRIRNSLEHCVKDCVRRRAEREAQET